MVGVLTSSGVNRGFETWWGQTKDYKFGICFFSAKHGWLGIRKICQSGATRRTLKIQLSVWISLSSRWKLILFLPWGTCSWKIAELVLNNNHSLYQIRFYLDLDWMWKVYRWQTDEVITTAHFVGSYASFAGEEICTWPKSEHTN